jgi:hypothetical protein
MKFPPVHKGVVILESGSPEAQATEIVIAPQ